MNKQGTWILLDSNPSKLFINGIPHVGDAVKIELKDKQQPWSGKAKFINRREETLENIGKSPEYGVDILYSGIIL